MASRFTPVRSPVEMVLPLRDTPGTTAKAWATPTTRACQYDIPLRVSRATGVLMRFPAWSDTQSSAAVMQSPTATCCIEPLKRASTWSLKRNPTMATGITETRILQM